MTDKNRNFKQNTLQRYADAGYLDWRGKYTAVERVSAGNDLWIDYYLGKISSVGAVDPAKIRVDGGGSVQKTIKCLYHQDRYNKAMSCLPKEFWDVVRKVCIDDEPIETEGTRLDMKRKLYAARIDLCRGLDRLVDFYKRKKYRKNY